VQQFTSTQAKQHFGELMKAAELGPVAVERHHKVQVIVVKPDQFAASTPAASLQAERKLARLNQALVERDRLIRHQQIAIDLLTLPAAESRQLIKQAKAMVARWREAQLCSADYIERWSGLLALPLKELASAMVGDLDGWGSALRQNSPWVGVR
jgi:hypothetical protein